MYFFLTGILFCLSLPVKATIATADPPPFQNLTLQEFVRQKNRTLEATYGLDLSWKQRIALNLTRRKVKRHLRKYPEVQCQPLAIYLHNQQELEVEKLSLISLLASSLGFVIVFSGLSAIGFGLGFVGAILGLIGINKVKTHPEKYTKSSKTFAIIGMILGAVSLVFLLTLYFAFGR